MEKVEVSDVEASAKLKLSGGDDVSASTENSKSAAKLSIDGARRVSSSSSTALTSA